jgi:hypothetical protein
MVMAHQGRGRDERRPSRAARPLGYAPPPLASYLTCTLGPVRRMPCGDLVNGCLQIGWSHPQPRVQGEASLVARPPDSPLLHVRRGAHSATTSRGGKQPAMRQTQPRHLQQLMGPARAAQQTPILAHAMT